MKTLSTSELLALAGLQRRPDFWHRALPIAAGVGAGIVAGAGLALALFTPQRRERVSHGVRGLFRRRRDAHPEEMHSDAPGTQPARSTRIEA